jgi:hypothetical protein
MKMTKFLQLWPVALDIVDEGISVKHQENEK